MWNDRFLHPQMTFAADGVVASTAATEVPASDSSATSAAPASSPTDAGASSTSTPPSEPAATPAATDVAPAAGSLLELADTKPKVDGAEPAKEPAKEPVEVKPEPAKDTEKPKEDPAKEAKAEPAKEPAKEAAAAEPPAPIKYETFKIPDAIKLDDKELAKFTEIASAAGIKQDQAQSLIDLYIADATRMRQDLQTEQRRTWDTLNDTWKDGTRKDPQIGGNRLETSLSMAKAFIEEYGGTPEQVRDLIAHTTNNGMGNYVNFIRLMCNAGRALNVFEDKIVGANNGAPKPARGAPGSGGRGWYKDENGAAAS